MGAPGPVRALLVAVAVALAGSACAPDRECTAEGCESRVDFAVDTDLVAGVPYYVTACIDGACERRTLEVPPAAPGARLDDRIALDVGTDVVSLHLEDADWSGEHDVQVRVTGPGAQVLAELRATIELERSQPNGPDCDPVCWYARVT